MPVIEEDGMAVLVLFFLAGLAVLAVVKTKGFSVGSAASR